MRHCLILSLFLLSTSVAANGQPTDGPPAFPQALAEAEAALAGGEIEIAESRFRTALLEGWLLLGALAGSEGRLAEADSAFETALSVAAETRRATISLAMTRLQAGDARQAALMLRKLISEDYSDRISRRLLAQALAEAGEVDEAVQELEELRGMDPDNLEYIYSLTTAYLRQNELEAAAEQFAELAEKRPIPATHVLIGRTYRDFSQFEQARAHFEAALEMDPTTRRAHYYLGTLAVLGPEEGVVTDAIEEFRAELEIAPDDPMANLYLGMGLVEERRHEEALPYLEKAAEMPTVERNAKHYLGTSYLALRRNEEAIAVLREALALAEVAPTVTDSKQLVDYRQDQISSIHYQLGRALRAVGDREAAAVHFDAARESSAVQADSSRERLRTYLEDGGEEGGANDLGTPMEFPAVANLDAAQRAELRQDLERRMAQIYLTLGLLKLRSNRFEGAADLLQHAAELAPDLDQVQYSLGTARFNSGRYESAIEPLAMARQRRPDDAALRRMLAMSWWNAGEYEEAAELLRDDPERPANPSLQYVYGVALARSGRGAEAEAIFTRLLQDNADWPELRVVLAQSFAQRQDYTAAIESLERAIEVKPEVAEAHTTLGEIYLRLGRLGEAADALRTELQYRPDDVRARYTLALVLDLDGHHEEALELLRQLLDDSPTYADARYLLGKILLAQGEPQSAVVHLEAAVKLAPEDFNIHYQLGQTYQRLGRREEARQEFEAFQRIKNESRTAVPNE